MVPPLETRRLLLQPLQLSDAVQAQELFPRWEIVRYLANRVPWPFPEDGVYRFYHDHALPAMERGEEWHWSLRLKRKPEQMIGSISLVRQGQNNRGFWIGVPWQREGLMTEAVEVVTDFWFEALGFEVLSAPKAVANEASLRISAKTGMRMTGTGVHDYVSGRLETEFWEITRDMWLQRCADRRWLEQKEKRRPPERRC